MLSDAILSVSRDPEDELDLKSGRFSPIHESASNNCKEARMIISRVNPSEVENPHISLAGFAYTTATKRTRETENIE